MNKSDTPLTDEVWRRHERHPDDEEACPWRLASSLERKLNNHVQAPPAPTITFNPQNRTLEVEVHGMFQIGPWVFDADKVPDDIKADKETLRILDKLFAKLKEHNVLRVQWSDECKQLAQALTALAGQHYSWYMGAAGDANFCREAWLICHQINGHFVHLDTL